MRRGVVGQQGSEPGSEREQLRWVQLASVAVLLPTNALRWARSRCPALRWVPGDRQHGVSCSCWVGTTCSCSRLDYNSCRLSVCTILGAA